MGKKHNLSENMTNQYKPQLGKIVPNFAIFAFGKAPPILLNKMVKETLNKEDASKLPDQMGVSERMPTHPEYDAEKKDDTKGDAKPVSQSKEEHPKKQKEAKFIKLSGLINVKPKKDTTSEKVDPLPETNEKDDHLGKVEKDDKQGLPDDLPTMKENTRGNIRLSELMPNAKMDVPASPVQNGAEGTPNPEAVMKLNNTPAIQILRDKLGDEDVKITQVVSSPSGEVQVGFFSNGKEHMGVGRTASEAARKAAITAIRDRTNAV